MTLKRNRLSLDSLRMHAHQLADLGKAISRRTAFDETATDCLLKRTQTSLNGRLIHLQ